MEPDLRERVARQIFAICDNVFAQEVFAENAVGQILDIPEIKEALRSQCSSCDGARGPLLCTECVRDFIRAA